MQISSDVMSFIASDKVFSASFHMFEYISGSVAPLTWVPYCYTPARPRALSKICASSIVHYTAEFFAPVVPGECWSYALYTFTLHIGEKWYEIIW